MSLSGQVPAARSAPQQTSGPSPDGRVEAAQAADRAAVEALLRCLLREDGVAVREGPTVRVALGDAGPVVEIPLEYHSPTGWHRFGAVPAADGGRLDAAALARLLCADRRADVAAEFAARVADSVRRTARHLADRRGEAAPTPFLEAEQSLLVGHPFHPTPHSRQGVGDAEAERFSPELRGRFPLHWFAADPEVVQLDEDLIGPLPAIFARLAGPGLERPAGTVVFPAHPWQARDAVTRPGVRALLDAGLLHDLGPAGPDWSPTSSVRTLYRADAPVMLKTSLGAEIADSRRENLRSEMSRGLAVHRMLDAGLKRVLHGAHPGFDVLRDLGWLNLRVPATEGESGLELVVRDNPFGPRDRVQCVAGLTAARPASGPREETPAVRSLLGRTVHHLALHTGRPLAEVADTWLRRYLDVVVAPVLWLYAEYGLGLEAHQQNTLVVLDPDGWPIGGRYRGNQGYHFSPTRGTALARWLPPEVREDEATWATDAVVDERLGYCVGVNNVLGLVGALGAEGLADENRMLHRVRTFLTEVRAGHERADQSVRAGELITTLLDAPQLRCKANLRTRVAGLAAPPGPRTNRTVYVDIANPIAASTGIADSADSAGGSSSAPCLSIPSAAGPPPQDDADGPAHTTAPPGPAPG